eukprot:6490958-Amphidinium_carterae.1
MGEREDEQAYKLNETMDELSGTVNQCLSQLALEMKKVEDSTGASVTQLKAALNKKQSLRLPTDENQRLRAELGRMEARLALSTEEKEMLHQQACAAQHALKVIRHEAHLFRDKMLVDAKASCQYHVDKLAEMNHHYQGELQGERSRMHNSNKQFREKLEQEALEYQQEAEMAKVVNESATSRSQLKAQFEQDIGSVRPAAYEQEHAARINSEQALASMRQAGGRQLQELDSECGHLKEQYEALTMQMRSVARAFTLPGTIRLEDVEWHDGRRELFDQMLDDCACECETLDEGGFLPDGSVKALPGLPEGGIPPLAISERVGASASEDGATPDSSTKLGSFGRASVSTVGGTHALANGTAGNGGGGGGSGPGCSRGDPLHRKDPWHGATATTLSYTTGGRMRAGGGGGEPSDDGGGSERHLAQLPQQDG